MPGGEGRVGVYGKAPVKVGGGVLSHGRRAIGPGEEMGRRVGGRRQAMAVSWDGFNAVRVGFGT